MFEKQFLVFYKSNGCMLRKLTFIFICFIRLVIAWGHGPDFGRRCSTLGTGFLHFYMPWGEFGKSPKKGHSNTLQYFKITHRMHWKFYKHKKLFIHIDGEEGILWKRRRGLIIVERFEAFLDQSKNEITRQVVIRLRVKKSLSKKCIIY